MRDDVAGDRGVLCQRLGLPSQNVWPILDKSLVLEQPGGPARAALIRRIVGWLDGPLSVRDRVLRI